MRIYFVVPVWAWMLCCQCACADGQTAAKVGMGATTQAQENTEPAVLLELGAAASWDVAGGPATYAPSLAAETTPIEGVLELEAGTARLDTRDGTEWDTDFLFKKPWALSPQAEFMLGTGPEWVHLGQEGRSSDALAAEVAGDFMFWPTPRHRLGWFVEPVWDYSFAGGHPQSVSITVGLLIGVGRKHSH